MSIFRSMQMGFYSLVMPRESAWEVMNRLGELSALQFIDLNPGDNGQAKPYTNYIKRCDEMESKLKMIEGEMEKFECQIEKCSDAGGFMRSLRLYLDSRQKAEHTYFEEVESELEDKMKFLNEQVKTYEDLITKHNELTEYKHVLAKTKSYVLGLSEKDTRVEAQNVGDPNAPADELRQMDYYAASGIKVSFLAGTVPKIEDQRFKRMIFRVTRGNSWIVVQDIEVQEPAPKTEDKAEGKDKKKGRAQRAGAGDGPELPESIIDPSSGKPIRKCVFLIVYQGGSFETLKNKLVKICDSFGATRFHVPEKPSEFSQKHAQVQMQLAEIANVSKVTKSQIETVLDSFSAPRYPVTSQTHCH